MLLLHEVTSFHRESKKQFHGSFTDAQCHWLNTQTKRLIIIRNYDLDL